MMEGGSRRGGRSWPNPGVKTEFLELPTTQAGSDADEVDLHSLLDGMMGPSGIQGLADMSSSSSGRTPPTQTQQQQRSRSDNQVQKLREELKKANGTIGYLREQLEELAGVKEENASLKEQLDQELQQKYDIGVIVEWETRKLEKKLEREREMRLKAQQDLRTILREKNHMGGGTSSAYPGSSTVEEDEVVFVGEINPDGPGVDEGVERGQVPLDPQRESSQVINEGPSSQRQGPPLFSAQVLTPTPVVRVPGRNLFNSGPSTTTTAGPVHGQRQQHDGVASGSRPRTTTRSTRGVLRRRKQPPPPSSNVSKGKFRCGVCDKTFSRVSALRIHKRSSHGIVDPELNGIGCQDCAMVFQTRKEHINHRMQAHGTNMGPKSKTPEAGTLPKKRIYVRSKVNRDDKKKNVTPAASASGAGRRGARGSVTHLRGLSVTLNASAGHQLVGSDPMKTIAKYECSCGKSFGLRSHFLIHLRTKKYGKIFSCKFCDQRFQMHASLKTHVNKIHNRAYEDSKYGCGICGRLGFMTNSEVREHRQNAHGLSH